MAARQEHTPQGQGAVTNYARTSSKSRVARDRDLQGRTALRAGKQMLARVGRLPRKESVLPSLISHDEVAAASSIPREGTAPENCRIPVKYQARLPVVDVAWAK